MTTKRKAGRPPKPPGEKYQTPGRRLGRVANEEWAVMQAAAELCGTSFTEWARGILLRAAKRKTKTKAGDSLSIFTWLDEAKFVPDAHGGHIEFAGKVFRAVK